MFGVKGNLFPKVEFGRKFLLQKMNCGGQQKLQGVIGELAQYPSEVARSRERGINVKAPRVLVAGYKIEAQDPDQGGTLKQIVAQVGHIAQILVDLNQQGADIGGAGMRLGAGPGAMGVSFREMFPVQRSQQHQVSHRRPTLAHKSR